MKGAAVLIVLFLLFLVLAATAAVSKPAAPEQVNVTATLTATSIAQLPPRGRVGDLQRQRWRITDRHGRSIGRMFFVCQWPTTTARMCGVELQLPEGKLTALGSSPTPLRGEYAVTGGTGRFQGGGGVMTFTAIGLRKQVLRVVITR